MVAREICENSELKAQTEETLLVERMRACFHYHKVRLFVHGFFQKRGENIRRGGCISCFLGIASAPRAFRSDQKRVVAALAKCFGEHCGDRRFSVCACHGAETELLLRISAYGKAGEGESLSCVLYDYRRDGEAFVRRNVRNDGGSPLHGGVKHMGFFSVEREEKLSRTEFS